MREIEFRGQRVDSGECRISRPCVYEKGVIVFLNAQLCLKHQYGLYPLSDLKFSNNEIEVVGNIHSTPELLKGEI